MELLLLFSIEEALNGIYAMKYAGLFFPLLCSLCLRAQLPWGENRGKEKPFQIPVITSNIYDSSVTGYYFMAVKDYALIVDCTGSVVYQRPVKGAGYIFTLEPDGRMCSADAWHFIFLDSAFHQVDSLKCKSTLVTDPHELLELPGGHYLLLAVDSMDMDLSKYSSRGKYGHANTRVIYPAIQELDEKGGIVFEWHGSDHLAIDDMDESRMTLTGGKAGLYPRQCYGPR